jgi:hypothetical protein
MSKIFPSASLRDI